MTSMSYELESLDTERTSPALRDFETLTGALLETADLHVRFVDYPRPVREDGHLEVSAWPSDRAGSTELVRVGLSDAASPSAWGPLLRGCRGIVFNVLEIRRPVRWRAVQSALTAMLEAYPDAVIGLVVGTHTLSATSQLDLRQFLALHCSVDWLAWLQSPETYLAWSMLVLRSQPSPNPVQRIVDARGVPTSEAIELVAACRKRTGGEGTRERLRHGPLPVDRAWTWWGLSRGAEEERRDWLELGESRPLSEVARVRLTRPSRLTLEDLDDPESLPETHVAILQASAIGRDGTLSAPTRMAARAEVDVRNMVEPGDVVVGTVFRERVRLAVVPQDYPRTAAASTVLVMRFGEDVDAVERAANLAYLRSERYGRRMTEEASITAGMGRVTPAALDSLGVPRFDARLLDALRRNAGARQRFLEWARELEVRDAQFFDAGSFRLELPEFLARSRVAADQVEAAADVDTLEGRIRQRFPHPLAFRYETVAQMDHGAERVRATLECAEHFVLFLALLGLANDGEGAAGSLRAWTAERGTLSLDWGKADTLLREMAARAYAEKNPLASVVPEFERMHAMLSDGSSSLNAAWRELRKWRNDDSHLVRATPDEVEEASSRFAVHVRTVFEAASFITQTPLVAVQAYGRDLYTDHRRARFTYLVGVSAAHKQTWMPVDEELRRGDVGVLDLAGRFHSLHPWIIRRPCTQCKHAETFILNRFESTIARYVAMESGHKLEESELATALRHFIERYRQR